MMEEAYKNYKLKHNFQINQGIEILCQEEFIHCIKTDDEFAKKWGLKVDERGLSLEERTEYKKKRDGISRTFASYTHQMLDGSNIPTKVISLTYNNQTEVIYE
jgi:hypothetical protein